MGSSDPVERRGAKPVEGRGRRGRIRYAVVGLGHIAQVAVLPAFRNARRNSELGALFSGDRRKRDTLARRHRAPAFDYDAFEEALASESIDAVYLALPNDQHCAFTERAARAGVHVLCEKPMAVTVAECDRMIAATEQAGVRLMIAYRLHFEATNLRAAELAQSGRLGDLRLFSSTFSMQVRDENIRVEAEQGGGPLYDIGIYCIQAARAAFRAEPTQVMALSVRGDDLRFAEVDEAMTGVLRFPGERLATFTCSFGAADVSSYRVVGEKGSVRVEPAYDYAIGLALHTTLRGRTRTRRYARRDQFAPELLHFSNCLLQGEEPEPSGREGKVDVQIIEALLRSAKRGEAVDLPPLRGDRWPSVRQELRRPAVRKPALVHAESGSR